MSSFALFPLRLLIILSCFRFTIHPHSMALLPCLVLLLVPYTFGHFHPEPGQIQQPASSSFSSQQQTSNIQTVQPAVSIQTLPVTSSNAQVNPVVISGSAQSNPTSISSSSIDQLLASIGTNTGTSRVVVSQSDVGSSPCTVRCQSVNPCSPRPPCRLATARQPVQLQPAEQENLNFVEGFDNIPDGACDQIADPGTCVGNYFRYAWDANKFKCRGFYWTGCGGNDNRFVSRTLCENTCRKANAPGLDDHYAFAAPVVYRNPFPSCSRVACPPCSRCYHNRFGQPRCVPQNNCCSGGARRVQCAVNPCQQATCGQTGATPNFCVNDCCGACRARFYNARSLDQVYGCKNIYQNLGAVGPQYGSYLGARVARGAKFANWGKKNKFASREGFGSGAAERSYGSYGGGYRSYCRYGEISATEGCVSTCRDYVHDGVCQMATTSNPTCFCAPNHYRDHNTGRCIPERQCTGCGPYSSYRSTGNLATCADQVTGMQTVEIDIEMASGSYGPQKLCTCDDGYVIHDVTGICISKQVCQRYLNRGNYFGNYLEFSVAGEPDP